MVFKTGKYEEGTEFSEEVEFKEPQNFSYKGREVVYQKVEREISSNYFRVAVEDERITKSPDRHSMKGAAEKINDELEADDDSVIVAAKTEESKTLGELLEKPTQS